MAQAKTKSQIVGVNYSRRKTKQRPTLDPQAIYTRTEAAQVVGCSVWTLERAQQNGHVLSYYVGRHVKHSGQHLIDWLEAGGQTR